LGGGALDPRVRLAFLHEAGQAPDIDAEFDQGLVGIEGILPPFFEPVAQFDVVARTPGRWIEGQHPHPQRRRGMVLRKHDAAAFAPVVMSVGKTEISCKR